MTFFSKNYVLFTKVIDHVFKVIDHVFKTRTLKLQLFKTRTLKLQLFKTRTLKLQLFKTRTFKTRTFKTRTFKNTYFFAEFRAFKKIPQKNSPFKVHLEFPRKITCFLKNSPFRKKLTLQIPCFFQKNSVFYKIPRFSDF